MPLQILYLYYCCTITIVLVTLVEAVLKSTECAKCEVIHCVHHRKKFKRRLRTLALTQCQFEQFSLRLVKELPCFVVLMC